MFSQATTTLAAPARLRRAAKAPHPVVDLHDHAWFNLFHGQDLTWPDSETTVETIAAAIRAAA